MIQAHRLLCILTALYNIARQIDQFENELQESSVGVAQLYSAPTQPAGIRRRDPQLSSRCCGKQLIMEWINNITQHWCITVFAHGDTLLNSRFDSERENK